MVVWLFDPSAGITRIRFLKRIVSMGMISACPVFKAPHNAGEGIIF